MHMLKRTLILLAVFLGVLMLGACGASPSLSTSQAPTVAAPTEQQCAWTPAYADAPPEFAAAAQNLFAASGISGTLQLTAYGENNSCDGFHLQDVSFEFTVPVEDLSDQAALKVMADQLTTLPQQLAGQGANIGQVRIKFAAGSQFCWWQEGRCA